MARDRLRIVTWNVWFGQWEHRARQRELWNRLLALEPDVVCVQEMLPEDLDGPEFGRWRERGYWQSDEYLVGYDVMMLGRVPVVYRERVPLRSEMGRNLLIYRLAVDPPLTVATIHLESTEPMTRARVQQLRDINARLMHEEDVVLLGDMNFADDDAAEMAEVEIWRDAWLELRPDELGFTVDSHVNHMRFMSKQKHVQKRIDRVFQRGDGWELSTIMRLGTKPLRDDPRTFVSDHFGLVVELRRT